MHLPMAKGQVRVPGDRASLARLDALRSECGGRLQVREHVPPPKKVRATLEELGPWTEPPRIAKAREQPQTVLSDRASESAGVEPPTPQFVAQARLDLDVAAAA